MSRPLSSFSPLEQAVTLIHEPEQTLPERVRALSEAATPGPWMAQVNSDGGGLVCGPDLGGLDVGGAIGYVESDAAFIVEAVNYVRSVASSQEPSLDARVKLDMFGLPLCAHCGHAHNDGPWSDSDPDDGTCWATQGLVCGCPKWIAPDTHERRRARFAAKHPELASRLSQSEGQEPA